MDTSHFKKRFCSIKVFEGFCEGDTRNRWHDGQVCQDVDKELWRLEPDSSGVFGVLCANRTRKSSVGDGPISPTSSDAHNQIGQALYLGGVASVLHKLERWGKNNKRGVSWFHINIFTDCTSQTGAPPIEKNRRCFLGLWDYTLRSSALNPLSGQVFDKGAWRECGVLHSARWHDGDWMIDEISGGVASVLRLDGEFGKVFNTG
ncbi:hypothetical protein TNCV_4895111 [Trichonephila clavipes]|nr:hypothetical protein TNCV_4895111 [Trichonephila clavipes]